MNRRSFFATPFAVLGLTRAPAVSPLIVPIGAEFSVGEMIAVTAEPGARLTGHCAGEAIRRAMLKEFEKWPRSA